VNQEIEYAPAAAIAAIIIFKFPETVPILIPSFTGSGDNLIEICRYPDLKIDETYYGDLVFWGNKQNEQLEVRFQFKETPTGKPANTVPGYLEIEILSESSGKSYPIKLNKEMKSKKATIRSRVKDFDFSKGIKLCGEIRLYPVNKDN